MELSIDTSTRYASVALSRNGEIVAETSWRSEQNHSIEVMPALLALMERQSVEPSEIDAVFVAKGPGGFSALRVGVSIVKTFAEARRIPLVAIGTLEVEARPYVGLGLPVFAAIEAGKDKLYVARYGPDGTPAEAAVEVETHDEAIGSISTRTVFCGEAVGSVADLLRERLGELAVIPDVAPPTRRPGVLARLGFARLLAADTDDPATLQPSYMRGSQFDAARQKTQK